MKIGSLFSGYGGLDLAVMKVTGAEVAWHCEWEAAPSAILEKHFSGVPNYHDVSKVDFTQVEPVDILTGGFPCQDLSLAGKRAGLKEGTRSGLWLEFARAIEELQPRLVVIENVRGLLSATAHSDLEFCPWCMGENGNSKPSLRALGAVLGSLADLGYDARWSGVRASDAGAPHQRFRVFIIAYPRGGQVVLPTPSVAHLRNHDEDLTAYQERRQDFIDGKVKGMPGASLGVAVRMQQEGIELLRSPKASEGQGGALGEGYEAGLRRSQPQLETIMKGIVDGDERVTEGGLELLPTPNTMEHREIKTPEQIAALKAKSPGGYRNLREIVINEMGENAPTTDTDNKGL